MNQAEKVLLTAIAGEPEHIVLEVAKLVRDLLEGQSVDVVQAHAERVAVLKGFKVAVAVAAERKREELQGKPKAR